MTPFAVDLRRTLAAPRERVFRAFLDPELLVRWMHPDELAVTHAEVDARVGGRHLVEHLDAEGARHAFESVIEELVPDERLVLAFTFCGPGGAREDTRLTVTLRDAEGGGTELRLVQTLPGDAAAFDPPSVDAGWTQVLARLAALGP